MIRVRATGATQLGLVSVAVIGCIGSVTVDDSGTDLASTDASLMLGWTALLLSAYQRPLERRFVAALTVLVIYGLVATEIAAVVGGHLSVPRMLPTRMAQSQRDQPCRRRRNAVAAMPASATTAATSPHGSGESLPVFFLRILSAGFPCGRAR